MTSIRNFCIISHIDHGKSTLADRLLELTNTVTKREMKEQLLDQMDLEREKGITIKLQPVRLDYICPDGEYVLNLIDTPGHVDFTYEVSRSLAACEGALLLVDASQGIQAQTIANLYLALDQDLVIIPIINKIDLPNADPDKVALEIENILGVQDEDILRISAKTGEGVEDVLRAIVGRIPIPAIDNNKDFRALIFDSVYSDYQGVIAYVRVFDGDVKKGDKVKLFATEKEFSIEELGWFKPDLVATDKLMSGEVGYIVTGLKNISQCKVGDTIAATNAGLALSGYKRVKPVVFASFYPVEANEFTELKEALAKLSLNDASLTFELETSPALGKGFRLGFLGLLHMEIIQERLRREYNLNLVLTTPSVAYKIITKDGQVQMIYSAAEMPDLGNIQMVEEPWVTVDIISPEKYLGSIMNLVKNYRGIYKTTEYFEGRVVLHYELPLAELITDFYDNLKSATAGYASLNYEISDYRAADLVKMDILVAGDAVEALSRMVVRSKAFPIGKAMVGKLKNVIPAQNFQVAIQAAIGGKIVARETIRALRKDVTAKLYGGDVTRKQKLLAKQKKGKKKMKQFGRVAIPQEAFLAMLKKD